MSIHVYHFIAEEGRNWLNDIGCATKGNGPYFYITIDRLYDGGIAAFLMSMDNATRNHPSFPFYSNAILDFVEENSNVPVR